MSQNRRLVLGIAAPALAAALAVGLQATRSGPAGGESTGSPFDGARAFQDMETVVGFGARPSGSENIERTREYIVSELEKAGLVPVRDAFTAQTPIGEIDMANVRAIRPGASGAGTIAIAGHYDTKRFDFNFLGASDGGSSAAVVLELARVSNGLELQHDLEFILFDGEEATVDWTATDSLYGSRYDVRRRFENGTLRDLKALILVDMVGDRDLTLLREGASTPWLVDLVWSIAERHGYGDHFTSETSFIDDDHRPYLNAGIDAIDLIDFDYPYWHTPADTLDKTSAESLKIVGDVIYHALAEIEARISSQ